MTNQFLTVEGIGVTKETIVLSIVTDNFLTYLKPDLNHEPFCNRERNNSERLQPIVRDRGDKVIDQQYSTLNIIITFMRLFCFLWDKPC